MFLCLPATVHAQAPTPPYAPILTEISPFRSGQESPWIELFNPGPQIADASQLTLVINDDFTYTLPKQLSRMPAGSFIVLSLDAAGERQNTYRFSNNMTTLHAPASLQRALSGTKGQIAVYRTTPPPARGKVMVDFVAWGAPGSAKSLTPERNRIWRNAWFVSPQPSFGDYEREATTRSAAYVIGLVPNAQGRGPSNWMAYASTEQTPGRLNHVARIGYFSISDNAAVRSEDIAVGWPPVGGAVSYKFQISRRPDFGQLVEERTLPEPLYRPSKTLEEGTYYYRVKAIDKAGRESEWSSTQRVISKKFSPKALDGADGAETVLAAMQYKRQRKDSHLLCLDGCASDLDGSTARHWDNIHPDAVPTADEHGNMNCARASIAMMASFYGGNLSQDRIAYYTEEEKPATGNGIPEGDLAHMVGMNYSSTDGGDETDALEWALDATTTFMNANPTFAQIRTWIDNSQPIMTRTPGHLRAMNGYRVDTDNWVHIMDPWSGERWETYATWNAAAHGTWAGPVSAPTVRSDEPSVWVDSDADGVMDFDEQVRFLSGRFDKDSDNDGIEDKNEVREYVFNSSDNYSKRDADVDIDGLRKETDPDNDADGRNDGCEDTNHNGKYEPGLGETNNFTADAGGACGEKPIHAIIVFDRSGSMVYPPADAVFKYDRSAESATLFLDTWLANDVPANTKIGLVFYDHSAYFDAAALTNTTLEPLTNDKRDKIVAAFDNNRPNYGSTSIGGGISKSTDTQGFNVAGIPADDQHRTVIVLTDGMENTPPYMSDPAIVSSLATNKIDGYVLGIGDETQIDSTKLNSLADILNHTPASLAKDLTAFQTEQFFLQVLAETQGLEFSTDPVYDISTGQTRSHSVPVNAGARRVTFVTVWNEPGGKLQFTLKDPNGAAVPADVTKAHNRYQVSTKNNPVPGNWTVLVTAPAAPPSAPGVMTYSVMALEKNPTLRAMFRVRATSFVTGAPLLLTADLSKAKQPLTDATITVEVKRPKVGVGTYLSSARVRIPHDLPLIEREAKTTPIDRKAQVMALDRMAVPTVTATVQLNDRGVDGDEIANDGRYSGYFHDTTKDGIYTFRLTAAAAGTAKTNSINREKTISVALVAPVHPIHSFLRVDSREFRTRTGDTLVKFTAVPRDRFNNSIGPGQERLVVPDVNGKIINVVDSLDGSYQVEMIVPGEFHQDYPLLRPVRPPTVTNRM